MARLSDVIEEFIKSLLGQSDGSLELQRNELADYFDCAPSQINYVLATRFSLDRGYHIESRRGGGGFIKIVRIDVDKDEYIFYLVTQRIGNTVSEPVAGSIISHLAEQKIVTRREANIMKAAIQDKSLNIPVAVKDNMRAGILKAMLTSVLTQKQRG
jgi:transcriptional regulator CtsR